MPDEAKSRDAWDKVSKIANMLAVVAIPVVLGVYGNVVSESISDQETSLAYVELAVSILVEAPDEGADKADDDALREWASNILRRYSGVPLNERARQALINRQLPPRLSLGADAISSLTADIGRTSATGPTASATEGDEDSIVISKDILRQLNPRELSRLGVDPSRLDRRNDQ